MDDANDATVVLGGTTLFSRAFADALSDVRERIARGAGGYVCFVNVHTLTEATRHRGLRAALDGATYCFVDGVPLLWLAKAKRTPVLARVCGPDFMAAMLDTETDRVHGFIGGAPGVADLVAKRAAVKAITYSPPRRDFSVANAEQDWSEFLARCPDRRAPAIVWIGLGAPKQELWCATVSRLAPQTLFFAVGAAFDFLAGTQPRASPVLQRLGLEWTHRLAREPRRLWRRYLESNARFVVLSVRELIESRQS